MVGKLFAPEITDTRIIASSNAGFLQHFPLSWGIDHGDLEEKDRQESLSLILNEALDEWIRDIPLEERGHFIDELFDALAAGGADTFDAILEKRWDGLDAILQRLNESNENTRKVLSDLSRHTVKAGWEDLRERITGGWQRGRES